MLAQLLQERGLIVAPEQIINFRHQSRRLPDVLVDFRGLRLAIEGELASLSAERMASDAALQRVEQGIAHIGMALIYPKHLRAVEFNRLKEELAKSSLRFAIITESDQLQLPLFPEQKILFTEGDLDDLVAALRRAYEQLIHDEVLVRAVELIEEAIASFMEALVVQPAATERFKKVLEVKELPIENPEWESKNIQPNTKDQLTLHQRNAITRISALILINAMIFQEVLSQRESKVKPLQEFQSSSDPIGSLADHWKFILDEINYYPIFHIALKLLCCLSADPSATKAIKNLLGTARQIVEWRASLRHDLVGRIYHRLLAEAKYLGAYYTSIPAAVILVKLALRPEMWKHNWTDLSVLKDFRIVDFSCGTGTLLMAVADAVVDNYIRACAQQGKQPDMNGLHSLLVKNMLYGFDVLDSAVHLTASTLALRNPEIPINVTHLGKRDLGGRECSLGSLDFLQSPNVGSLFSQPELVKGKENDQIAPGMLPLFDLCVMNPPFTRSVGGNLLFGNLPQKEREALQAKLRKLVKQQQLQASITAGLGSVFIALADKYLKDQGRLALVVPRALLSGAAWEKTRELFKEKYHLEWLIVSHEPQHWNFSENTNLSEVLVIARKRESPDNAERVICVNLWKQPRNAVEALGVVRSLIEIAPPDVYTDSGALDVSIGEVKLGEALSVPWAWLNQRLWNFPCAFAQAELVRTLFFLLDKKLYVPGLSVKKSLPLCPLGELGELGFDRRDIHDGFSLAKSKTCYPAFWGHDADTVTTLKQKPNQYLSPLTSARKGRPLRRATDLWKKAGHILLADRLRLNTMRVVAVWLEEKVLSNVWWTFVTELGEDEQKSLVLWLNSTLGLLLLLGHREETEGAFIGLKKPVLEKLPVLDVRKIRKCARRQLANAFDSLGKTTLLPFPDMEKDNIRAAIDHAIATTLGLPNFTILRKLLAREPIICLDLNRLL
ncbi:MAG: N-6 DNA methylase [Desulfurococcaceae archaeon]